MSCVDRPFLRARQIEAVDTPFLCESVNNMYKFYKGMIPFYDGRPDELEEYVDGKWIKVRFIDGEYLEVGKV